MRKKKEMEPNRVCKFCKYSWYTEAQNDWITCPNCQKKSLREQEKPKITQPEVKIEKDKQEKPAQEEKKKDEPEKCSFPGDNYDPGADVGYF
jgi:hypothetical protein